MLDSILCYCGFCVFVGFCCFFVFLCFLCLLVFCVFCFLYFFMFFFCVLCFCKVSMLSSTLSDLPTTTTTISTTHPCPNPEDQCLDGQTCCQISETDYGCCPFAQAVCCKDMAHCCPQNTLCDLKSDSCRPNFFSVKPPQLQAANVTLSVPAADLLFKLSNIN